jgi:type II secretory pathway pseudopilin PulG
MIEVVAVLVIIGIISAVAVSNMGTSQPDLIAQADSVKTHLRFAQLKALQDDTGTWGISFAGNSYTLTQGIGAATPLPAASALPSESGNTHFFPAGVTVNTTTVTFDPWGSPGNADIAITLTQGSNTAPITVTANTGYIP